MKSGQIFTQMRRQSALLTGIGLPLGFVAGFAASVGADTLEATGEILMWGYLSLAAFLAAGIAASVWLSVDDPQELGTGFCARDSYRSLSIALLTGLLSGVVGTLGATVTYFLPGQSIPMLLEGYGGNSVNAETVEQLGVGGFLVVATVTVAAGLLSAVWGYRRVKKSLY